MVCNKKRCFDEGEQFLFFQDQTHLKGICKNSGKARGKKILGQLSRTRFFTGLENPAFFFSAT